MENMEMACQTDIDYGEFYTQYYDISKYTAYNILNGIGSAEDVEECVNDALYEVMINYQKYDESRGSMKTYIRVVTRSKALYKRKRLQAYKTLPLDDDIEIICHDEDRLIYEDLIKGLVMNLKPKEKSIFTMRFLLHMPSKDIAKELRCSVGAVDKRILRLKKKLMIRLNELNIEVEEL